MNELKAKSTTEKTVIVPLLLIATIFAGMLSPMQSAVNG